MIKGKKKEKRKSSNDSKGENLKRTRTKRGKKS